jgi:signal transduction histidine kinase/ActR/RegA family two-component response regulator
MKMARYFANSRQLTGFFVLAALAATGNYFSIPLFFGVDFVFGSVAVFVILRCFGLASGLAAAALGAIPTIFLWSHPFALPIFTAEALAIGLMLHRRNTELILADGLFWLVAGIPLAWLFYFGIMRVDAASTLLVSLKLSANGIVNALVASLLLDQLPLRRWLGLAETAEPRPLADVLFRLILALVLFPTFLLMVINGRASIRDLEVRLQAELNAAASDISYHIATRMALHQHAVATLAEIAANFKIAPSRPLQRITDLVSRSFPNFHNMYIADENGITVAFGPPVNRRGVSTIGLDFSDRPYFHQLKATKQPVISDLFRGRGGVEEPIIALAVPILKDGRFSGYTLGALDLGGVLRLLRSYARTKQMEILLLDSAGQVIAATDESLPPMTPYALLQGDPVSAGLFRVMAADDGKPAFQRWLDSSLVHRSQVAPELPWILLVKTPLAPQEGAITAIYIRHLAVILLLSVLTIFLAGAIGRRLSRSIKQLGMVTSDLPGRLLSGGSIDHLPWPRTRTREMQTVTQNFQAMAATLEQSFRELQARSRELASLNDELQAEMAERHRLEETVQRQKRMETIGNLAAGVAHDLNNILSGLVGYPDLLLHELPADSPMRGRVLRIKDSGERAAAVVQDLLTLARRGVVQKKVINLNALVESCLASPDADGLQARHPDITVRRRLAPDLLNVSGSEVHLAKSFMNLVINAAEAMPAGGEIVVATANRSLDTPVEAFETIAPGDYAMLEVTDNGIGIAAPDQKKIFEPFYTKKVMGRSGTGLGMSVVWTTVKDHDGFIDLQSEEGRGTAVKMYLPVTREEAASTWARVPVEEYLGDETVLVVDDLEDQREIAAGMLRKLGYRVFTAAGGEEAIGFVREQPVDLLVLDMIMEPGPDGLETYRRILEIQPEQKALIASGFAENERVREAQRLGVGAYIAKPYTLEKLGLAVRMELDRRKDAKTQS